MRVIISPAKKMKTDTDFLGSRQLPRFLDESKMLLTLVKKLNYEEAKALWKCNDAITELNLERLRIMDLTRQVTPALFAYEGLQYQHIAPGVFEQQELEYLEEHLRILSGFYGVLRPFDGVVPYRLEMQAKLEGPDFHSLYQFWNRKLAEELASESSCILNLASKEYSKCISPYLSRETRFITCVFGQCVNDNVVEKGTLAKMARGEMVRYMAERQIDSVEEIKAFNRLRFRFDEERSTELTYVFIQE
ncbi:peroxide stress protein YaaA [Gorillibacterium timonense]|uniref:peroxide stress protein YaaA n=1 Tax=Gorillibacterium timonense TaxID=1689269 RepID=UPI00071C3341|nr:peroxide stress protein YaaA [Gorillibacterium timonense]